MFFVSGIRTLVYVQSDMWIRIPDRILANCSCTFYYYQPQRQYFPARYLPSLVGLVHYCYWRRLCSDVSSTQEGNNRAAWIPFKSPLREGFKVLKRIASQSLAPHATSIGLAFAVDCNWFPSGLAAVPADLRRARSCSEWYHFRVHWNVQSSGSSFGWITKTSIAKHNNPSPPPTAKKVLNAAMCDGNHEIAPPTSNGRPAWKKKVYI
eukprot:SAG31_NODE_11427_length_1031_cov_5.524678_1_plen_208_part_00